MPTLAYSSTARPSASPAHPTQEALRRLSGEFAQAAEGLDREGGFPHAHFPRLHQEGLISYAAPAPHGAHASLAQCRRVIAAIGHAEPATALILAMTWLQHRQLAHADSHWPAPVQARVLASAAREGALINALRVEPDLGTPARGGLPATVARRAADGWLLSGRKIYATGSPALRWMAVWARTDDTQPRVGIFLVERNASTESRLRIVPSWNHMGLRASGSHEVVLEDVPIPTDHAVDVRLPQQWTPQHASDAERAAQAEHRAWINVLLGSLYDAVARAAYDWLLVFLAGRTPSNLGAPLSTLPRVREHVGEIAALLHANRVLLDQAAADCDAGSTPGPVESGLLKYNVTRNAIAAVEQALKLSGNPGLSRNNPLERHYRDVLCSRVHTPQDDTILTEAGHEAFARRLATQGG